MKNLLTLIVLFSTITVYGQAIYKKGYIVNLESDTIRGYILLKKQHDFYDNVTFKKSNTATAETYLPTGIKAYGYSNKEFFESWEIPGIKKSMLLENEETKKVFLRVFSSSKNISFYSIYQNGERIFFIKNEMDKLIPLLLSKKNVDDYKIRENSYKLPNDEVITANEGAIIIANDEKIYLYQEGVLYQLIAIYKTNLRALAATNNCDLEDKIKGTELSKVSLSSFSKMFHSCIDQPFSFFNKKNLPQVTILAIGSTHPFSRNLHIGYERGLLVEFRDNSISPNWSIGLGFFKDDVTNTIKEFKFQSGDAASMIARTYSKGTMLKINYHLREGKMLRPYCSFNSKILNYQIDLRYIDTGEFFTTQYNTNYKLGASIGVDYYLFRYAQVRAEIEYSGIFSYQVGLGVSIY